MSEHHERPDWLLEGLEHLRSTKRFTDAWFAEQSALIIRVIDEHKDDEQLAHEWCGLLIRPWHREP